MSLTVTLHDQTTRIRDRPQPDLVKIPGDAAMPSKKITMVRKPSKPRKAERPNTKAKNVAKNEDRDTVKVETPTDIFTTFSTDAVLKDGLNVIRSLGNGKYEIVSLDTVSQNAIGSVETAEFIKSDPKRRAALHIGKKQWDAAELKCDVAVRITGEYFVYLVLWNYAQANTLPPEERDLFRFFKLPLELRYKIYEFALFNPKGLSLRTRNKEFAKPCNGLSLMLTCRQIYKESKKFFWHNNFYLNHGAIIKLREKTDFAKKLEVIDIYWDGKWADAAILSNIGEYPSLRVLNISLWTGAINWDRHINRNVLYQGEQNIKLFSKLRGFDQLASMRGLARVTFETYGDIAPQRKEATEKAIKAFEEFLNRELTKPRPLPVLVSSIFLYTNAWLI